MLGYYIIIRKKTDNIIKNFNHLNIILWNLFKISFYIK